MVVSMNSVQLVLAFILGRRLDYISCIYTYVRGATAIYLATVPAFKLSPSG